MLMTADEWFLLSKSEQKSVLQKMQKGGWLVRVTWNPATKETQVLDARRPYIASAVIGKISLDEVVDEDEHAHAGHTAQECELYRLKTECLTVGTSLRRVMEEVEDAQRSLVAASANVVAAERRLEAVMESIDRLRQQEETHMKFEEVPWPTVSSGCREHHNGDESSTSSMEDCQCSVHESLRD